MADLLLLVLLAYGLYKGIIPLGVYSGPRTYVIPELVERRSTTRS